MTPFHHRFITTSVDFPTNLFCQVEAKPDNVTFHWSSDRLKDIRSSISSKLTRSKLTLVPLSKLDFGLYSCWAKNSIGAQRDPCIFNVSEKTSIFSERTSIFSEKTSIFSKNKLPSPVTECKTNVSVVSVRILCLSGDFDLIDRNLNEKSKIEDFNDYINVNYQNSNENNNEFRFNPIQNLNEDSNLLTNNNNFQIYHLHVRDSLNNKLVVNLTKNQPIFSVDNLNSGTIYQFIIFASNNLGNSEQVTMMVQTLNDDDLNNDSVKHLDNFVLKEKSISEKNSELYFKELTTKTSGNGTFIIMILISTSALAILTLIALVITIVVWRLKKVNQNDFSTRESDHVENNEECNPDAIVSTEISDLNEIDNQKKDDVERLQHKYEQTTPDLIPGTTLFFGDSSLSNDVFDVMEFRNYGGNVDGVIDANIWTVDRKCALNNLLYTTSLHENFQQNNGHVSVINDNNDAINKQQICNYYKEQVIAQQDRYHQVSNCI